MPTNAAVLAQWANEGTYGKEAMHRMAAYLKTELGAGFEAGSDALQIFHGTATALAAGGEIRTNGGVKIYAVHVQSPAAATQAVVVRFFNTSTATALLTTTGNSSGFYRLDIPVDAAGSQTVILMPNTLAFQTAASYGVVGAADGTTAAVAGSAPTVTVLYANI